VPKFVVGVYTTFTSGRRRRRDVPGGGGGGGALDLPLSAATTVCLVVSLAYIVINQAADMALLKEFEIVIINLK